MKKQFALALILIMLLSMAACGEEAPAAQTTQAPTQATAETTQAPTTEAATEAATEGTTEATQAQQGKVTVYLLESSVLYDSGSTEYHYDENYNVTGYTVYTIENEIRYTAYLEEPDGNGMPCRARSVWPDGNGESRTLTYFADGRLQEEQQDDANFCGYQYAYDDKGNLTEKREYYEGILESAVYYTYTDGVLTAAYCEDKAGNRIYECRIENGLIVEKIFQDAENPYSYLYEYDENNNLVSFAMVVDGEKIPGEQYTYKAVDVDADRAGYLEQQQKYLLSGV